MMEKSLPLAAVSVLSILMADAAAAQPRPPPGPRPMAPYGPQGPSYHYYNGRWVSPDEWRRHGPERDRWVRDYERRRYEYGHHHDHEHDDTGALVAGIIGFALGAAIIGSAQQAEHARTADRSWDDYCASRYRSYDRRSRTYLGVDGLRHYCQ